MATNTKNLGLIKPEQEDFYNVDDFNQNFQKLDDFSGRKDNPHDVTAEQTNAVQRDIWVFASTKENSLLDFIKSKIAENYTSGVIQVNASNGIADVPDDILSANGVGNYFLCIFQKHYYDYIRVTLCADSSLYEYSNRASLTSDTWATDWVQRMNPNGYLPLVGGTLQGDFRFNKGKGALIANDYGAYLQSRKDASNYRNIRVDNPTQTTDARGWLKLVDCANGSEKQYRLYGEHNFFVEDEEHPYCFYRTVYGEREWLNPPMEDRVAYKTSERYNGASVFVYSQEVYFDGDYEGSITNIPVNMNETKHFIDISGIYQGKVIGSLNDETYKVTLKFIEDNQYPNGGYYDLNIKTSSNLTSDVHPAKIRFICKYITEQG